MSDAGLAHLAALTDLKRLWLTGPKLDGSALKYLKGLKRLEQLGLDWTQVDDASLANLSGLSRLARLGLQGILVVHVDDNGYQQCDATLVDCLPAMRGIFPVSTYGIPKGQGVKMFESAPWKSTHLVSAADYAAIVEEIK